jgi:hypothetical protein
VDGVAGEKSPGEKARRRDGAPGEMHSPSGTGMSGDGDRVRDCEEEGVFLCTKASA